MDSKNDNEIFAELIYRLNIGAEIDLDLIGNAFDKILTSKDLISRDAQLGVFLSSLMVRGPRVEEIVLLAKKALSLDHFQQKEIKISNKNKLVCVSGSGKKGYKTVNISTPSAILASAMGATVIKPGSTSTSSLTGSSDFMSGIGYKSKRGLEECKNQLEKHNFCLVSIEDSIPKFDHIYGQKMLAPTPLSFVLPSLICPIKYDALLYGLSHPNLRLVVKSQEKLGVKNMLAVCSTDDNVHFIDELGLCANNYMMGIKDGQIGEYYNFNPLRELHLPNYTVSDIKAKKTREENIKSSLHALMGRGETAIEDVIAINASLIAYLSGVIKDHREGYEKAKDTIHSGLVLDKLKDIIREGGDLDQLEKMLEVNVKTKV